MSAEGSELAKAYVAIAGDSTQLNKELSEGKAGAATWLGALANGMKALIAFPPAIIAVLSGGVFLAGAAALAGWTLKAIDAEVAAARLTGILDTVGRNSGQTLDGIDQLASALELVSNFSRADARAAAAELLKFNEIQGDTFTAALKAASDYATVLGTDLVSAANNIGMALQNPTAAIRTLRQAGLTADQGKQIQDFVKAGQINAARNVVLGFFAEMSGAAEKLTATTQYSIDALWRDIKRLGGSAGNAMLPVVKEFFDQMRNVVAAVQPGFDRMAEVMQGGMGAVREVIATIGGGITTGVQYATTAVLNFGLSWEIVQTSMQLVFAKLMQYWENFKATLGGGVDGGIGAVENALTELAFTLGKVFGIIGDAIKEGWRSRIELVLSMIDGQLTAAGGVNPVAALAGKAAVAAARWKLSQPFERFDEEKLRAAIEAERRKPDPDAAAAQAQEAADRQKEIDQLGQKLGGLVEQMRETKEALFPAGAQVAAIAAAKAALSVQGGFGADDVGRKAIPVKLSFVGLGDAWKQMQASLTGGTMIDLTQQGLTLQDEKREEMAAIKLAFERRRAV